MTVNERIRAFALEAVGSPYVYGATGQKCTPGYRREQMAQYPGSAGAIRKNCPVLSGGRTSCDGCRHQGKQAFDCAQVTRLAAEAAGLALPSGASSQWNEGDWAEKGTMDTLPEKGVCFLYLKRATSNPMGHTGVYLGDGTAVDARSHAAGVVRRDIGDVKWTHWALLNGQEKTDIQEDERMSTYKVTGTRLALRERPSKSAKVLLRMDTGTAVDGQPADEKGWVAVKHGGKSGYCMAAYLAAISEGDADELTDKEKLDILWAEHVKEGK